MTIFNTCARRRAVVAAAVAVAALWAATAAMAGASAFIYGHYWFNGQSASSSFSPSWYRASFNKPSSGYDTTITLIDNVTYSWHGTRRSSEVVTWSDAWFSSASKKGYCKAWSSHFYGSCYVYN